MNSEQLTCMGCLVQPHFDLTNDEKAVLNDLKEAWEKFVALGDHIEHDLT